MGLKSELFRGDPRLEAAAISDPAHVVPGATGPHVEKIQAALMLLDGATLDDDDLVRKFYGDSTARAVLSFKQKRGIINKAYQTQADNIVGKMTVARLDSELSTRPPSLPLQIEVLSFHRKARPVSPAVAALLEDPPPTNLLLAFTAPSTSTSVPTPPVVSVTVMELRPNAVGTFKVTNGAGGTVQVVDPGVAKLRQQAGKAGASFPVKTNAEAFQVPAGAKLGSTLVVASANGFSASFSVVVKPFGGPPPFHEGVHHDHTPSRKFDEVIRNPNNSAGSLKAPLDATCKGMVLAADSPIPLPHGPELLVVAARAILFAKRPLASVHLEFYLNGNGVDFNEDANIKDWITRDKGIRQRLKREIFLPGKRKRLQGQFFFGQGEYAKDDAGQDFRFSFGGIDKVDYEVDLASNLVRVWFKDRYEWHPFYPKLYPVKSGDSARDDNCVHAALVEMQDQGAADYWMKGVAEVPISLIAGP